MWSRNAPGRRRNRRARRKRSPFNCNRHARAPIIDRNLKRYLRTLADCRSAKIIETANTAKNMTVPTRKRLSNTVTTLSLNKHFAPNACKTVQALTWVNVAQQYSTITPSCARKLTARPTDSPERSRKVDNRTLRSASVCGNDTSCA